MKRFLALPLFVLLTACAAMQPERSFVRDIDDANASLSIKSAMTRADGYSLDGVDVEVTNGVALLTGTVPDEDNRRHAECLAWSALSINAVENEVIVAGQSRIRDGARDAWITQQVRARLLGDRAVRSVNYNVEVENGRVFLLGVARTQGELERAAQHASLVEGVSEVVTFVRVAGEGGAPSSRGERQASACGGEAIPAAGAAVPSLDDPEDVRTSTFTPID